MTLPLPQWPDDRQFEPLVAATRSGTWPAEAVARLAAHLAASGETLAWESTDTADVASTGGPGSLSTLISPLGLRELGFRVVKMAVPGRPAGAIDALGTLPGYRVRLTTPDVRSVVDRCGYAHFLADARFAPLDASLFEYRKRTGAVAIPALAAASLLAKKLAAGLQRVGLDVRVGAHGNFGATMTEARSNAALFCASARLLGLSATAFLSTRAAPVQPWLGRGESLTALALAIGLCEPSKPNPWLSAHVDDCLRMAVSTVGDDHTGTVAPAVLWDVLRSHLEAQGSTLDALRERAEAVLSSPRETISATESGVLVVDLGLIRDTLVAAQADATSGVFLDPAGLELLARPGTRIVRGQPLAAVRCTSAIRAEVMRKLRAAIRVAPHADPDPTLATSREEDDRMETVRG